MLVGYDVAERDQGYRIAVIRCFRTDRTNRRLMGGQPELHQRTAPNRSDRISVPARVDDRAAGDAEHVLHEAAPDELLLVDRRCVAGAYDRPRGLGPALTIE